MSYGALGLVEVLGSCNAVVVLDQMLKTSDVEFRTWHTKCGGHATIFLSGDIAAVKAAVDAVKQLSITIKIPQKLSELNVKEEDLGKLAESAFNDVCTPGNPRKVTVEEIKALYTKAF